MHNSSPKIPPYTPPTACEDKDIVKMKRKKENNLLKLVALANKSSS